MPRAALAIPPHPPPIIPGRPRHGATSPAYGLAFLFDAAPAPPANDVQAPPAPAVNTANPKWVQICAGGEFSGYRGGGRKFVMDRKCFDTMIANLRRHPSYVAGVDAMPPEQVAARVVSGELGVLPFDFDHRGGPAEAWALDLQVREGAKGLELWAYTYFLEPAYTWMLETRYKWTSITWEENGTDPVTAEKVGPYLINVAFTNDPFVQGMHAIQCSRTDSGVLAFAYQIDPWNMPGDAVELVCAIRALFGLPEIAPLEDVLTALTNLRGWVDKTLPVPPGVVVRNLLRNLRRLLGLKPLDGPESIWTELDKLLGRLADEEETEDVMPTTPAPGTNTTPEPTPLQRALAARLTAWGRMLLPSAPAIPADEGALAFELERFGARADEAFGLIASLKKMFGTDDPKTLTDKVTALMAVDAQLGELLPEIASAASEDEKTEEQMAAGDVDAALAALGLHDAEAAAPMREALMLQRMGLSAPEPAPTKEQLAADRTLFAKYMAGVRARRTARYGADGKSGLRAAFRSKYGLDRGVPVPAHLRHVYGNFFTGAGAMFGPPGGAQQGAQFSANAQPPQGFYAPGPLAGTGQQPGGAAAGGAPPGAFTWARIAQLPPNPRGDNPPQRVFDELIRTEFGGKAPTDQNVKLQLWGRVNQILSELTAREGNAPLHLFRAA